MEVASSASSSHLAVQSSSVYQLLNVQTIDKLLLLGGVPVARALGTRNLNICALELALASEDDVCESVVCCWP